MRGFTLIELLVVAVIVAVLALVAYPAYTTLAQRVHRSTCQGQLMALAAALESYRAHHFSYQGATVEILSPRLAGSEYYRTELVLSGDGASYVVTATPREGSVMAGDGALMLDSLGQTCRQRGQPICVLGAGSTWNAD